MTKGKRIAAIVAGVLAVVAIAGSFYWFSMPSEQRNILLFMMLPGESYDEYEEYQVVERNDESLENVFETYEAVSLDNEET